jgi:hypothetical protein
MQMMSSCYPEQPQVFKVKLTSLTIIVKTGVLLMLSPVKHKKIGFQQGGQTL